MRTLASNLRGFSAARRYSQATQKVASLETIKGFWKCPAGRCATDFFFCWMHHGAKATRNLMATIEKELKPTFGAIWRGILAFSHLRISIPWTLFGGMPTPFAMKYRWPQVVYQKVCWLQNLGCRYWNHMPQPSLLLEGKKFLRIKDEGRLVVDVWTPRTWKKKRHSMSWTHWHVLSLFGGEGFFIENCPSTKARMQRWATLSSK